MATTQEAIARLRMIFETQGADKAVAEMKKLETAETSLGTTSLNLDRSFANLERRYSETARATADYERAIRTLNAAVAQNPALAERAAAVQQTVTARYQATMLAAKEAHQVQTAYGVGLNALSQQATMFAASTGVAGSMLQTLGKGGLVAAVGLGAVAVAYNKIDEGVTNVAKYARETKQFAEATGLTTSQVQSLNKEAARFGVSSEELHSGLMKFTAGFEEVRNGGGAMLDIMRKISPALAEQAVSASDEQEALRIVGQALREAGNEFDRARLARAAFGKGGSDLGLMVKGLDMDALPSRGLSKAVIDDLARLQSEVDARSTNISSKIYASFGKPFLEAKNDVLAYIESVMRIGTATDASKAQGGRDIVNQLSTMFPLIAAARNTFESYAGGAENAAKKTDELTSAQERLEDAFKKTAATSSQNARGLFRFQMEKEEPGSDERRLAALKEIMALYPGLVAQDAIRMQHLDDQLRIAEALPGVARMEAEEQARINQLLLEGRDLQLAITIAGKERAIAQAQINTQAAATLQQLRDEYGVASAVGGAERMRAQARAIYNQLVRQGVSAELAGQIAQQQMANTQAQINSQAQQQLFNLKNQAGVAAAVTGADRIRAQYQATLNALLQQGVDLEIATAVAAQERANAEAQVNAQVSQQIISLEESTQLIYAQLRGNEDNVKVQQAYNRAIRDGADAEHAAALAAATYNNLLAQRTAEWVKATAQAQAAQQQADAQALEQFTRQTPTSRGLLPGAGSVVQEIESAAQAGSQTARTFLRELQGERGAAVLASPDLSEVVQKIRQEVALAPQLQQFQQAQEQAQQQLRTLQDQARLGAAATPQEKAQIQWQITYEQLIKQGVQASLATQIANQELANTMQDLAKSVDENTTALQAQLDPIYTEGRAALRIGYYGEGAGGTMRTVTGTGFGTPANMNAPAAPTPAPAPVVVINQFAPGAVMGDRRTQYQAANSYGRAIQAMGT
jgi:hypothetical protein